MIADLLCFITKLISGLNVRWIGCQPERKQRVYFANHTSHFDFLALWAALPKEIRKEIRPVVAKDYWEKGKIRRFISHHIINALLIDRLKKIPPADKNNPLNLMLEALRANHSLIIFPEGTRSSGDHIQEFKSGIYHLIKNHPVAEFVPVYLENLNRILPKGEFLPIPILGTATFGRPVTLNPDELKESFLARARHAIEELRDAEQHDR